MLGLSLGKLLFLAIAILVVWYGFKYVQRVDEVRQVLKREKGRRGQAGARAQSRTIQAEDLVKCGACGAYVTAGSTNSCGRADCPWGR